MSIIQTKNGEANFNFSNAVAFEVFSLESEQSTTSTTFQVKLSGTSIDDQTGKYVVHWFSEIANTNNNATTLFRVQWKNTSETVWKDLTSADAYVGRSNVFIPMSGFRVIDKLVEETMEFRIEFARGTGGTAKIKNTNLYLFRVAI